MENIINLNSYEHVFIYNKQGEIIYSSERGEKINSKISFCEKVRNARKIDFKKGDTFHVKCCERTSVWHNGKDIYIPDTTIQVKNVYEKKGI